MSPIGAPSGGNAMASMMSAHRDVLDANPTDTDGKERLYNEVKNRAKAAVQAKHWKDAEVLYEKGLEVCPTVKDEAVLHANMSLCQRNMGGYDKALENAEFCVKKDDTYLKGYWRLGQVLSDLHRYTDSLEAYNKALKLDPTNKAIKKECTKLEEKIKEEEELMKQAQAEQEQPVENDAMDIDNDNSNKKTTTTTTKTTTTTTTTTAAKMPETTTATKASEVVKDDDGVFSKSDHVKGYQIVNGKKTTFFHNEISEEAKQLIGDITPKRLDETNNNDSAPQRLDTSNNNKAAEGTSVWNKAGTWEERDVTSWAVDTLKAALLTTTYTLPESSPDPNSVASIKSIKKCDGHASFAMVRGKKRYIYEFLIEIEYQISLQKYEGGGTTVTGTMTFPDVDGTCELGDGYDMVDYHVSPDTPGDVRPLLDRFVKNDGLRTAIHQSIDDWVRLFRATY